jgi:hypothetical protein
MRQTAWDLPGPASFVRRVAEAIREGRSVSVQLPQYVPEGFAEAVRVEYEREPFLELTTLHCDGSATTPLNFLFEQLAPTTAINTVRDIPTLTTEPAFCGRLILLETINEEQWTFWREFLEEYEQVCRNVDRLHRSLFFVCLEGGTAMSPPREDVCQAVFRWSNAVDHLDAGLFATGQLAGRRLTALERQLTASLLSELALWDTEVCARLAAEPMEKLLEPLPILCSIAQERGWSVSLPSSDWWALGIEDDVEGVTQRHSAFLAISGDGRGLNRRIWRAQLRVLFPAVEELRLALMPDVKRALRPPIRTPFGVVYDVQDLEIGQIAYHLHNTGSADRALREQVSVLRDFRHALAHLEPIRDAARLRRLCQWREQVAASLS